MADMNEETLVLTSGNSRQIDQAAIDDGVSSQVLMESAGRSAAELLMNSLNVRRVAIAVGGGGNGGDALVLARVLYQHGIKVRAFAFCSPEDFSPSTELMAELLEKVSPGTLRVTSERLSSFKEALAWSDCIVDGLLGIGGDRPISGRYAKAVELINDSTAKRVALDLPSGLNADQGESIGLALRADLTIAMHFLKPAHVLYPARSYCGEIKLARVDYPSKVLREIEPFARVTQPCGAKALLPRREPNGHKGTFGRVLVLAGSRGMTGAAILCCRGALRGGAGIVTLACPASLSGIFEATLPEVITFPLSDQDGRLIPRAAAEMKPALDAADVLAVGPGLSRHPEVGEVVVEVLGNAQIPIVVDADGLFPLASCMGLLKRVGRRAILTPHPGELSSLIGRPREEIDRHRIEVARTFAGEHKVITIVKGRPTSIGTPKGEVYLNPTGNTGLATGGSGDVLTGIIVGLLAGGASLEGAAIVGTYVHGYAADLLAREIAERSILPSDLIDALPLAIAEIERVSVF